jgi:hypothetical protein
MFTSAEKQRRPPSKEKNRGNNLSTGNMRACHSMSNALMQSVAETGTQSPMKSSKTTLHQLSPHTSPPKNAEKEHK